MTEKTVGRIRKDGGWDRRFRVPLRQAEPFRMTRADNVREVLHILLGIAVLLTWGYGIWLWIGIWVASQVRA